MIQEEIKTEAEYRLVAMDSSSSLKDYSQDRRKYVKKYIKNERVEEEDNKSATIGRVVETLLLEPDEFDNRFYLSSVASAPTGNMALFVEALYKHSKNNPDSFSDAVKEAYKDSGYKWTLDKVLEKFNGTDNEIYFKEIQEVRNKNLTVVTADDAENAERVVEELRKNINTAEVCNLTTNERYLVQNQVKVENYEIDGLKLKSMMDKIIIDHKLKTIQCYDLKCVWAVETFFEEYYLYRRAYIQAYLYKQACYKIKEQMKLDYYTVKNPRFIVCDSINYYQPLIYVLSDNDMNDAYTGFSHKGRNYPGVKSIISDLIWSKKEDVWTISKTNAENNGLVNLR